MPNLLVLHNNNTCLKKMLLRYILFAVNLGNGKLTTFVMELGVLLFAKVNGTSVSYNVSLKVGRSPHTSIPLLLRSWHRRQT